MELAQLRLSIDSRPLADAKAALSGVDAGQKAAAASATALEAANRKAANAAAFSSGAMRNLSFQLNDVATMAATGASPFAIFATQGGQIYQALSMHPGGAGAAVRDLSRQVVSFLGPIGLFGAGLTAAGAAAYGLYRVTRTEGPTTEQILDEHARLLRVVKGSYDSATGSARHFYEQSREVTRLQLLQQQTEATRKLREETGKLLQTTLQKDFASFFGAADPQIASKFKPFSDAIYSANEALQAGTPRVREFVDEVARIGLQNPALQKTAAELIKSAGDASTFAAKLKEIDAQLKLLNGGKLTTLERKGLGLGDAGTSLDSALMQIRARADGYRIEAETIGMSRSEATAYRMVQERVAEGIRERAPLREKEIALLNREAATLRQLAAAATETVATHDVVFG